MKMDAVVSKMRETGGAGNGFQVVTPWGQGLDLESNWSVRSIRVHSVKSVDDAREREMHGAIDARGRVWFFSAPLGDVLDVGRVADPKAKERQDHALLTLRKAAGKQVRATAAR